MTIDVAFDFRTEDGGKDFDASSPTLRRYHKLLWSKPLPDGTLFDLSDTTSRYLHHRSEIGEFSLSSDQVIPTFTRWKRLKSITERIPESENEVFRTIACTIGAIMVFPGNRIDGKPTMNEMRGLNQRISDRLDLTLECIRRYYLHQDSPLRETISRYADFFRLFKNFRGYVEFFLLSDLVTSDGGVIFFIPFDEFRLPSYPQDVGTYMEYRRRSTEFIRARNHRIEELNL